MPTFYRTHVILPDDWEEFSRSPRQFRRRTGHSAVLTVSLLPMIWPATDDPDLLVSHLHEMLNESGGDVGEQLYSGASEGQAGLVAHSIRRSQSHGILCFWLIITNANVMVSASFAMGDPDGVTADLQDAQAIMQGLYLTTVNVPG